MTKYLLHCIFGHEEQAPLPSRPAGALIINGHDLAALVTVIDAGAAPGVERLLAYERLISRLHDERAVIPLRYGCVLASESSVQKLLENNRERCLRLLRRLAGMTEMGVRIISEAETAYGTEEPARSPELPPGTAYLNALRRRYASQSRLTPDEQEMERSISSSLSGLYMEKHCDVSVISDKRMVSICFLVPASAVQPFRTKIRAFVPMRNLKWMLSGPWPPYSFVDGAFENVGEADRQQTRRA